MSEWKNATLAEVATDVSYGYTESARSEPVGPKFLRITDIQGGIVNWDNVPYCPIEKEDHERYKLKDGDIVVARTGNSTGENYMFRGDVDAVFASYLIRFRPDLSRVVPRFVWYCMRTPQWWEFINGSKTGSAQAGANANVLGRFRLLLPPLREQQAIAHIIGTLDDKIELNRRRCRTLEEMARAIFKSWFVDFDPVRAKAAVRKEHPRWTDAQVSHAACPKLKPEIAALFPDRFEDSPLGPIPAEWRVGTVGDVIAVYDSKRIPLSNRQREKRRGPYPYYGAASQMDSVDDYLFDGVYVLMGEDGSVIKDDGTPVLQYVWGKFWVNNHAHVLQGTGSVSTEHLLLHLKSCNITPFVTGAVQPKLNQGNMSRISFMHAPEAINRKFGELITPLFAHIRQAVDESRPLAALRDTLLPKLISGELRVPDAERIVARAV